MTETIAKVIAVIIVGVPTVYWLGRIFHDGFTRDLRFWAHLDGYADGYDDGKNERIWAMKEHDGDASNWGYLENEVSQIIGDYIDSTADGDALASVRSIIAAIYADIAARALSDENVRLLANRMQMRVDAEATMEAGHLDLLRLMPIEQFAQRTIFKQLTALGITESEKV